MPCGPPHNCQLSTLFSNPAPLQLESVTILRLDVFLVYQLSSIHITILFMPYIISFVIFSIDSYVQKRIFIVTRLPIGLLALGG